jgi:hypothetical protein
MSGVFINYRKQDESGFAALLQRELSWRFGAASVFYASRTIRPGEDYEHVLLNGVRDASVLLAVIGPRWLTAHHPAGRYRINRRTDWVRREIAEAFSCGIRVIPILINDVERITNISLPKDISWLTRCQYLRLRHENVDYDLARICNEVTAYIRFN